MKIEICAIGGYSEVGKNMTAIKAGKVVIGPTIRKARPTISSRWMLYSERHYRGQRDTSDQERSYYWNNTAGSTKNADKKSFSRKYACKCGDLLVIF